MKTMTKTKLPKGVYLAFCPTGEGGGVDNSCSPANAGIFSDQLKREMGLPSVQALETSATIARQAGVNVAGIAQVEALYRVARQNYNRLRRELAADPQNADLRARFNAAAREDRRLRLQLNNLRDASAVIAPIDVPSVSREVDELARLRAQYAEARQSYNILRRRLRETPDDAELRAQFNAAVREDSLARRQLREFEGRQQQEPVQPAPISATPAERQERREERVTQRVESRVQEVRRGLSRVQQRINEQAAQIPIIEDGDDDLVRRQNLSYNEIRSRLLSGQIEDPELRRAAAVRLGADNFGSRSLPEEYHNTWLVRKISQNLEGGYLFKTPTGRVFRVGIGGYGGVMTLIFSDDRSSTSATGRGEAFHVFSNVVPAVTAFIDKYKPAKIEYTAAQESRFDLYDKLTETIMAMRPGMYKVRKTRHYGPDNGPIVTLPNGDTRRSRGGGGITLLRRENPIMLSHEHLPKGVILLNG